VPITKIYTPNRNILLLYSLTVARSHPPCLLLLCIMHLIKLSLHCLFSSNCLPFILFGINCPVKLVIMHPSIILPFNGSLTQQQSTKEHGGLCGHT